MSKIVPLKNIPKDIPKNKSTYKVTETNKIIVPIKTFPKKKTREINQLTIPKKQQSCVTRKKWHNHYQHILIDIYYIIESVIKEYFPEVGMDKTRIFHNLSKLLYSHSSKYIDSLIKE